MAAKFSYDVEVTTATVDVATAAGRVVDERDYAGLTYTGLCRLLDGYQSRPIFRGTRAKPQPGKQFAAGYGHVSGGECRTAEATVIRAFPRPIRSA